MRIRFQADNDLNKWILRGVLEREPDVDFQSAQTAALDGLSDLEVLAVAAAHGRILVSHDENSMPGHFRAFRATGADSPGVLVIPQSGGIATAIDDLVVIWSASKPEEWRNQIARLPLAAIVFGA